jgi:superfamily II DNA/RNA helicase
VQVGLSAPVSTVSNALYPVEQHLKTALLSKILDRTDTDSVLVFTRTKDRATRVAKHLKKAGFPVTFLQGDLSQSQRQEALNGFRSGKYRILVATDIAARGLDISRISHVINYDMPDTVDAYTHRIGRTGRAERTGDAFTFVTRDDRAFVWEIERVLGEEIERRTLEDFDYTAQPKPIGRDGRGKRAGRDRDEDAPRPQPMQRELSVFAGFHAAEGSPEKARKVTLFSTPRRSRRARSVR